MKDIGKDCYNIIFLKDCNKDIDKVEKQLIVLQNTDSDVEE